MDIEVRKDNSGIVANAMEMAIHRALILIGVGAESHAKENLKYRAYPHKNGDMKPYMDTGNLWNHINNTVQGHTAYIGTNVEYAIYIHEGTRHITPNRFIRDAVSEHQAEYIQIIDKELRGTVL